MSVLYLVVPLALLVVGIAVWAFIWAAGRGQFDDLDTPALRMLRDDGDTTPRATDATPTATTPTATTRTATTRAATTLTATTHTAEATIPAPASAAKAPHQSRE